MPSIREVAYPAWDAYEAGFSHALNDSSTLMEEGMLHSQVRQEIELSCQESAHQDQVAELRDELKASDYDPLTGLRDGLTIARVGYPMIRRASYFLEHSDGQEVSHGKMAALYIDLDNLKEVNDTAGHSAGDQYIAEAAWALASNLRPDDLLVRKHRGGGDEFIALLPGADRYNAAKKSLQLFGAVQEATGSTASFGVAQLRPEMSPEGLIEAADKALYHAKRETKGTDEPHVAIYLDEDQIVSAADMSS